MVKRMLVLKDYGRLSAKRFGVVKIINSVDYVIGGLITESDAKELIEKGWKVVIQE